MAFIVALLSVAITPVMASNEDNVLIVEMKTGEKMFFKLTEMPVLTFDSEKVFISTSSFSAEYADVKKYYFDDYVTDIEQLAADKKAVLFKFINHYTVLISGVAQKARLKVVNIEGKNMPLDTDNTIEGITVNLSNYPKGLYIITCGKYSFKVNKR